MAAKKTKLPPHVTKFHKLVAEDEKIRHKLYEKFGRVRCYLYKTGRSTPNPVTAKIIQKITGIPADSWAA